MTQKIALLWFRQDLRLRDNPALLYALENKYKIIPVFILDDKNAGQWKHGGASRWWLHQSLKALNADLKGHMIFEQGDPQKILPTLIKDTGAQAVFWNRCYEPWRIKRDKAIKEALKDDEIDVQTFNASLLWEPWQIKKDDGTPYKVFTPFYRNGCLKHGQPDHPEDKPKSITFANYTNKTTLDDLNLMPEIKWYKGMQEAWSPGEKGAQERLEDFLDNGLKGYKEKRNYPALNDHVSRLSPYLHFGEISPRDVWHAAQVAGVAQHAENDLDHFCSELGWREFSYSLLYHQPEMPEKPLQTKFNEFPWDKNNKALHAWQKGQTGIPIVDAGMRQLWQTGWMHNRVRMIVASLLIKNMLLHWVEGEAWFWDTLVDADLANNAASWQWVAGSGADAAPYFRIFNPVTQSEKFDSEGEYIRRYVPELKNMPDKYIHAPWQASKDVLKKAGIQLGKTYPNPIVELKKSREVALEAFKGLKS